MSQFNQQNNQPPFPFRLSLNPKLIVLVVLILAAGAILLTSFFIVDGMEHGVVLRLGKYSRTVPPGLNFKLPLGIEQNMNVPTEVIQNVDFGYDLGTSGGIGRNAPVHQSYFMLTGDLNIVDIQWAVQYRIVDPQAWLFHVEDNESTISDISHSVINLLVGDRLIMSIMSGERTVIEQQTQEMMNQILSRYDMGINVTKVQLKSVIPPRGEVQDAFEDVNIAVQDMQRYVNEGLEQYNQEIPRARGEAAQMIQVAQGYAAERVNEARGDTARFNAVLEEYRKAPAVTRSRLYLETMEEVLRNAKGSTLIDRNLDNFLPLQNLSSGGAR
ncbi:MAG: FtsH protease activity modulator HflK [Spirochaetales bacterium]|jgi:membrane protease subunit HflK|nr:FtsH protease activity modulator HflK [Spirochaetales bacterium]